MADRGFHWLMVLCGLSIFGIVALIALELVLRSQLSWHKFGSVLLPDLYRSRYRTCLLLGSGE